MSKLAALILVLWALAALNDPTNTPTTNQSSPSSVAATNR